MVAIDVVVAWSSGDRRPDVAKVAAAVKQVVANAVRSLHCVVRSVCLPAVMVGAFMGTGGVNFRRHQAELESHVESYLRSRCGVHVGIVSSLRMDKAAKRSCSSRRVSFSARGDWLAAGMAPRLALLDAAATSAMSALRQRLGSEYIAVLAERRRRQTERAAVLEREGRAYHDQRRGARLLQFTDVYALQRALRLDAVEEPSRKHSKAQWRRGLAEQQRQRQLRRTSDVLRARAAGAPDPRMPTWRLLEIASGESADAETQATSLRGRCLALLGEAHLEGLDLASAKGLRAPVRRLRKQLSALSKAAGRPEVLARAAADADVGGRRRTTRGKGRSHRHTDAILAGEVWILQ